MRTVSPERIILSRWRTVREEWVESRRIRCWRKCSCGVIATPGLDDDTREIRQTPIEKVSDNQGARQGTGLSGGRSVSRRQGKRGSGDRLGRWTEQVATPQGIGRKRREPRDRSGSGR